MGVLGVLLRHAGEGGELLPQGLNQRRGGGALLRGHGRQRGLVLLQDQASRVRGVPAQKMSPAKAPPSASMRGASMPPMLCPRR